MKIEVKVENEFDIFSAVMDKKEKYAVVYLRPVQDENGDVTIQMHYLNCVDRHGEAGWQDRTA